MSPINTTTFNLAKKYFREYEKFTSRQLIDKLEEDFSIHKEKSIMKTLSNLTNLGFLRKDIINNTHWYYWTRKTYNLFKDDQPLDQKIMKPEEFDQEHEAWMEMVERRKKQREHIQKLMNEGVR